MFINKIQIQNFKRFSNLTIDLSKCAEPPKLVLLIGANGSGKSCIFDAFEASTKFFISEESEGWSSQSNANREDSSYYDKTQEEFSLKIDGSEGTYDNDEFRNPSYKFYGRTAFRNIIDLETKFNADDYGEKDVQKVIAKNLDRANRSIDLDKRWDGDILYSFKEEINRKELAAQINKSLNEIFRNNSVGHFQIESIKSEIGRSIKLSLEVLIKKGKSIFPYEYLSAGEKQLFAILLNLYLRKKYLENTIVYLDEIDLHLNTAIQCDLLKEITENIIPDNSQLWTASHSLGFIDYARDYNKGAIIDFDNLDFDQAQILQPVNKNDSSKPYFKVALGEDFLANLIEEIQDKYLNETIAFSEGDNCQFLEKAQKLLGIKLKIKFLDGQGKDNLKAVFHQLKSSKEKILFIFDNDAKKEFEACTIYKNTKLIPFLLPKNEANDLCTVGIENLFDKKFFEESFPDRDKFYFKQNDNKGGYSYQLDKAQFCKYICQRNNPEDFSNFKQLFEQIEEVLK